MLHRPSSHVFRFVTALAACVLLAQLAPVSGNRRALKQDDEIILGDAAPVFPTEYYKGDGPGDGPYQYKEDSYRYIVQCATAACALACCWGSPWPVLLVESNLIAFTSTV